MRWGRGEVTCPRSLIEWMSGLGERPKEQCEKKDIDPDLRQLAVG